MNKIIIFVGNKQDLKYDDNLNKDTLISSEEAKAEIEKLNSRFVECSCKNTNEVEKLFTLAI